MSGQKRIVVKVGSSLLVNQEHLSIRYAFLHGLLEDIATLRAEGYDVVLASSGSVAIGLSVIGSKPEEAGVLDKQAAAACGQPLLLNAYKTLALEYGFDIAQILVTLQDMEERRRFLNTKNTVERLFDKGILPIVNENDTVTTEEIRVGDNDRLAAKVAQMIQAEHLVILTSIEGLYDRPPNEEGAQFVETVHDVQDYLAVTSGVSDLGSGGMLTKMQAANMAQNAGCETIIGEGIVDRPITSLIKNERRHTRCVAKGDPASSWAIWLTDRLQMAGALYIKDDTAQELRKTKRPIRPEDILSVNGTYSKGDVLHVYDEEQKEVARGLINFSSEETLLLARHPGEDVEQVLGYRAQPNLIAKENLVVLEEHHLTWDAPEPDEVRLVNE